MIHFTNTFFIKRLKQLAPFIVLIALSLNIWAEPQPKILIQTNKGDIILELDAEKAPLSVKNFITYTESGFYTDTIFHRIIKNFMIQGGGFTKSFDRKKVNSPIKNEAKNGLKNKKGTISMARTNVWDSATSQFFINLVDNGFLDNQYAVFGKVITGIEVVDKIGNLKTQALNSSFQNIPYEPVVIKSVTVLGNKKTNNAPSSNKSTEIRK
ncbi:peptidylprolyl isomerase A [bacterium]|jgi:peptidyl-prolyl cis-trans isomerase A (cyclophilin A)|nr:peptidylprolyl isomerase A [bacterium]